MTQMTIPQAMNLAMQQIHGGNAREADSILRQILSADPNHADATHMLGMLAFQSQQFDSAAQLIVRSIQLNPNQAGYFCNLGQVLIAMGKNEEAIEANQKALTLAPDMPEAWNNLGNIFLSRGRLDEAIECYQKVIVARPDLPAVWKNLAMAQHNKGDLPGAINAYQSLLALTPDDVAALNNLGNALQQAGEVQQSTELYLRAIALRSVYPEAHNNLGQALIKLGRRSEAIDAFKQAVAQKPDYAEAHRALGNALYEENRTDDAIAAHRRSLEIQPNSAVAQSDLGNALRQAGKFDEAIAAYRRAIDIDPQYPIAHFNLGLNLLMTGQLQQGWIEHEWRWRMPEAGLWQPFLSRPKWTGDDLNGRTILIHAEQGFGDSIQFARYLPMVAARGGKVILCCQPELTKLFEQMQEITQIISPPQQAPEHDVQCALMSLPGVFDTSLETIPKNIPYLRADAGQWQARVAEIEARKRIGLAWTGRRTHTNDRNRSMKLSDLTPLAQVQGAVFFNLQKENTAEAGMNLIDWTGELNDFSDTAALIQSLDLVISVDTAVAHLAGAMGKPVWLLLPVVADWRWLLDRADSPWYPTLRLFRQSQGGDWTGPISDALDALSKLD